MESDGRDPVMPMWRRLIRRVATAAGRNVATAFRRGDNRFLYWSVFYPFNFGDWIGPYLYKRTTGNDAWFGLPDSFSLGTVIMSAGSIIADAKENCVVWGSGIMSRSDVFARPRKILAVRGPYTRERCRMLGYECTDVLGDPGILLPRFYMPEQKRPDFELGIVPHIHHFSAVVDRFKAHKNVTVIDVRYPIELVINWIASCERVVSSSLHGLIVANAYGIRAGWVGLGGAIPGDDVKFYDYFASLGAFSPQRLNNAIDAPVEELIAFGESSEVLDVTDAAHALHSVCPFPVAGIESTELAPIVRTRGKVDC